MTDTVASFRQIYFEQFLASGITSKFLIIVLYFSGYSQVGFDEEFTCPGGTIVRFGMDGSLVRLYDPWNEVNTLSLDLLIQLT